MEVKKASFAEEMSDDKFYVIPFFQRRYVWNEDNWDDLIVELSSNKDGHFLGSYILKKHKSDFAGKSEWLIIDGQQRFTTLSILLKVCRDICSAGSGDQYYDKTFEKLMLVSFKGGVDELKIRHSMVDAPAFGKVMKGVMPKKMLSDRIVKCYQYFYDLLKDDKSKAEKLFEVLKGETCQMVGICLGDGDNEQAIFDTINSAGVRLTGADIVKNALFQRLMDFAGDDDSRTNEVKTLYKEYWTEVFDNDEGSLKYWTAFQSQGRVNRTRIELLLQCVAVIKGIFSPSEHSLSELADCYKSHLEGLDEASVKALVVEIAAFAELYRENFGKVHPRAEYYYGDDCQRLIHILHTSEITTFDPLVLKMLKDDPPDDAGEISAALKRKLNELESYVLRHVIAKASTKNFNKECAQVLDAKKSIGEYFTEKIAESQIGDEQIKQGLKAIRSNACGALVLFWMELRHRFQEPRATVKKLTYTAELEHIMPRKWQQSWPATVVPVINVETGSVVTDAVQQREIRTLAIQEIGNMTLLNGHLNKSVSNNALKEKIEGVGRKPGVRKFNDYYCTKDVIAKATVESGYRWNEVTIRERTEEIAAEFLKMW